MNTVDRKKKLQKLAEKNATRIERKKIFDEFFKDLSSRISSDLSQAKFESYDNSLLILKKGWPQLSEYVEDSVGLNSGYIDKSSFIDLVDKLLQESELENCYLLMIDKYKPIGAIKLRLRFAIESLEPLLEMGEERICIVSDDFKNSIYVEFEKNDFDEGLDYLVLVQGNEWQTKFKELQGTKE